MIFLQDLQDQNDKPFPYPFPNQPQKNTPWLHWSHPSWPPTFLKILGLEPLWCWNRAGVSHLLRDVFCPANVASFSRSHRGEKWGSFTSIYKLRAPKRKGSIWKKLMFFLRSCGSNFRGVYHDIQCESRTCFKMRDTRSSYFDRTSSFIVEELVTWSCRHSSIPSMCDALNMNYVSFQSFHLAISWNFKWATFSKPLWHSIILIGSIWLFITIHIYPIYWRCSIGLCLEVFVDWIVFSPVHHLLSKKTTPINEQW